MARCYIALTLTLLAAGGCATAARYTWSGDVARLGQAHTACFEATKPRVTVTTPRAVAEDLYKGCVEGTGYIKAATDRIPVADAARTCGNAGQTCLWLEPPAYGIDSPLRAMGPQ